MSALLPVRASDRLSEWAGETIACEEMIDGGNNLILRYRTPSGRKFIVKRYTRPRDDGRDRLAVEFAATRFMDRVGIDTVPKPLLCDPEEQLGVYSCIEGRKLESSEIASRHIDDAVAFLSRLAAARNATQHEEIGPASEACPSWAAYRHNVSRRLARFRQAPLTTPAHEGADRFVRQELLPVFMEASERLARGAAALTMRPSTEMTLSPSDFGFHNTLLGRDGTLYFLDFEYFGWDDPAKLIADFLYHPGFSLPASLRERFRTRALCVFSGDTTIEARLELIRPMVGLNWCLILLNKFLPPRGKGNGAGHRPQPAEASLEAQLEKSRETLAVARSLLR